LHQQGPVGKRQREKILFSEWTGPQGITLAGGADKTRFHVILAGQACEFFGAERIAEGGKCTRQEQWLALPVTLEEKFSGDFACEHQFNPAFLPVQPHCLYRYGV
jgi:hypothetical protein